MIMTHNKRLRRLAEERAATLGKEVRDILEEANVSGDTWRRWRNGDTSIKPATDQRIHAALRWAPCSRARIRSGEDPVPVELIDGDVRSGGTLHVAVDALTERWNRLHARVAALPPDTQVSALEVMSSMVSALEDAEGVSRPAHDGQKQGQAS